MFLEVALAATRSVGVSGDEVKVGLADKIAGFFDYIIGQVPSWIAGFIVFVLTIFVARIAKAAVESRISDRIDEEHQEVMVLAGRVTYFGILILGITVALKIAGIDLTTILAAIAFGIGFALRDLISNFLAGVFILVSRQFTIGDFIKVGSTTGKVMEIQTRATILKAFDGTKVIVPNAEIFTNQVVSFTTNPLRRVVIPLYISYDSDIKYALQIALKVLKKYPKILKKPPPSVIVKDYGDSSIDLSARFWVGSRDGWIKIKSAVMAKMLRAFAEAGIIIPYEVMHIETNQDTATEWKEAYEIAQKKMAEIKAKKAAKKSGPTFATSQNGGTTPNGTPPVIPVLLQPAAQPVEAKPLNTPPIEPPGAYAEFEEIDQNG